MRCRLYQTGRPVGPVAARGAVGQAGKRRMPLRHLRIERRGIGAGGKRHQAEPVAVPTQHIERGTTDRPGRSQDGNPTHGWYQITPKKL